MSRLYPRYIGGSKNDEFLPSQRYEQSVQEWPPEWRVVVPEPINHPRDGTVPRLEAAHVDVYLLRYLRFVGVYAYVYDRRA